MSTTFLTVLRSQAPSLPPIAQQEKLAVSPSMTKSGVLSFTNEEGAGLDILPWLLGNASWWELLLASGVLPRVCSRRIGSLRGPKSYTQEKIE